MVLDNVDGLSSLAASLSTVVELLEGWINFDYVSLGHGVH
jgi:hypothetical protein